MQSDWIQSQKQSSSEVIFGAYQFFFIFYFPTFNGKREKRLFLSAGKKGVSLVDRATVETTVANDLFLFFLLGFNSGVTVVAKVFGALVAGVLRRKNMSMNKKMDETAGWRLTISDVSLHT